MSVSNILFFHFFRFSTPLPSTVQLLGLSPGAVHCSGPTRQPEDCSKQVAGDLLACPGAALSSPSLHRYQERTHHKYSWQGPCKASVSGEVKRVSRIQSVSCKVTKINQERNQTNPVRTAFVRLQLQKQSPIALSTTQ